MGCLWFDILKRELGTEVSVSGWKKDLPVWFDPKNVWKTLLLHQSSKWKSEIFSTLPCEHWDGGVKYVRILYA